jgi:hypothetical protein
MTIHIPDSLLLVALAVVPPYLWSRFRWQYSPARHLPYQLPYRFVHLRPALRGRLIISQALLWAGGLGIFVAPYLYMGLFSGRSAPALCILCGWSTALCLAFAGGHLERRVRFELEAQECPQALMQ